MTDMTPITARPSPGQLLTTGEAAERLRLSEKALEHWRRRGDGPRFVRLGRNCVRYRFEDIEAFVAGRVFTSTAQMR